MPSPDELPVEARQAAWDALWRRLLQPIPDHELEPKTADERDQGQNEDDEAA